MHIFWRPQPGEGTEPEGSATRRADLNMSRGPHLTHTSNSSSAQFSWFQSLCPNTPAAIILVWRGCCTHSSISSIESCTIHISILFGHCWHLSQMDFTGGSMRQVFLAREDMFINQSLPHSARSAEIHCSTKSRQSVNVWPLPHFCYQRVMKRQCQFHLMPAYACVFTLSIEQHTHALMHTHSDDSHELNLR